MRSRTATAARPDLCRVIDSVLEGAEPVRITGRRGNAVLISEDDWRSIQETLRLLGIPGTRESIVEGMAIPVEDSARSVGF